jgi:hypothetical protein
VAAHFPDQVFSRTFRMAMSNAAQVDQSRYCNLFGNPYLSFQLLDNPLVKSTYCNTCAASSDNVTTPAATPDNSSSKKKKN